jgi:phosphoglycolate phosphatase-like HAD superfamily hydrolase
MPIIISNTIEVIKYEELKKDLEKYKLIFLDLDGTLVHLNVDWVSLKNKIKQFCSKEKNIDPKTNQIWELLTIVKKINDTEFYKKVIQIIEKDELVEEKYILNKELINIINNMKDKKIVIYSMNTRKCVNNFIGKNLVRNPYKIIAREDLTEPKPTGKDILIILSELNLNHQDAILIGNTGNDKKSAELAHISYCMV